MKQQEMLPNIFRHSILVEKIAGFLTRALIKSGRALDLSEVTAAALLHDITKTRSIQTHENHAETGKKLLEELGYPRIGEIVRCHVEIPTMIVNGLVSSEDIVNYADKRVLHENIVTLGERFQDLIHRYGSSTPEACYRLRILEKQAYQIEKKIFSGIDFSPEDLSRNSISYRLTHCPTVSAAFGALKCCLKMRK
ncbi:MAG: HDIG domain-containing protein [Deltaproteobacteria bacterium]|nr:HDIG domain-containing protein [Deltaproteobacteria bacterium]